MDIGDLVRYLDEEVLDVGVVVRIYNTRTGELQDSIDVLWDDGVWTHPTDQVEVISAAG